MIIEKLIERKGLVQGPRLPFLLPRLLWLLRQKLRNRHHRRHGPEGIGSMRRPCVGATRRVGRLVLVIFVVVIAKGFDAVLRLHMEPHTLREYPPGRLDTVEQGKVGPNSDLTRILLQELVQDADTSGKSRLSGVMRKPVLHVLVGLGIDQIEVVGERPSRMPRRSR